MNGKFVLLALVFIFAASGASIGLQAASGRVEIPTSKQVGSSTPTGSRTESAAATIEVTSFVTTPESSDCLPVMATLEATVLATEEVIQFPTPSPTPSMTPDCVPLEATPDFVFTPEATDDTFIATHEDTEDSERGRNRGHGNDDSEDHSGKGGGDDNSGHGGGDD